MITYPTFTTENFPESVDFRKKYYSNHSEKQKAQWSSYKFSKGSAKSCF